MLNNNPFGLITGITLTATSDDKWQLNPQISHNVGTQLSGSGWAGPIGS